MIEEKKPEAKGYGQRHQSENDLRRNWPAGLNTTEFM